MNIFKFPHFHILKLFLLISTISLAQKEANIWYFGAFAGLDFNSGVPVALTNGSLNTGEGCTTIGDNMGNLLFYTDGNRVWNKNHMQMPNGFALMGHASSTQSALIVQSPVNSNIYYIFTVPFQDQPNVGFRYSIVDMTWNGGLGEVINKNIFLHQPVTEKLTAVRHASGCAIWIIAHEYESDAFVAFKLDGSGVNPGPVSNIGSIHTQDWVNNNTVGQLKASPDGRKLALAILPLGIVELFDFDNATGEITNPLTFPNNVQGIEDWVYGIEFSQDGTKLYKSHPDDQAIYQYNLMAGSSTDIINSGILVGTSTAVRIGALQLGPDGKIYVAKLSNSFLGVINNPDALGIACNYMDDAVFLNGRRSQVGLPTFMQSHFYPQFKFNYTKNCAGDSIFFSVTDTTNTDSVSWTFGDTASGAFNTSADLNPYHIFNTPGKYNVQMTRYSECTSVFNRTITIYDVPQINLGNDTLICPETTLTLNAETSESTYLWQDGSANSNFTVSSPGTFWAEVTNVCGSDRDSIYIEHIPVPEVNLGNDTILCPGQSVILNATAPGSSYLWQDNSTDSIFSVFSPGLYWVKVTGVEGCSPGDSITVNYSIPPEVELGNDTLLCQGEELLLNVSTPEAAYQWQDNSTGNSYTVTNSGFYWVEVTNADGCSNSDSVTVDFSILPPVNLGNDTVLCNGQSIDLVAYITGVTFKWQDGSTDSVLTASLPGLYWVEAINTDNCSSTDTVSIQIENLKADFEYELIPCSSEIQFLNLSSDTLSSHWDFGDGTTSNANNPVHTYQTNEKYKVVLIINPGSACADTAQKGIPFENDAVSDTLFIPNIFTPNGDGKNDYFEVKEIDHPCTDISRLMIFNRWGKKVFEAEGSPYKWDGSTNENVLSEGVYFYVLEGERLKRTGSVTLLR